MQSLATNQLEKQTEAPAPGAVIRVEHLHKYYEAGETRVHALRDINLEIQAGDFVSVAG